MTKLSVIIATYNRARYLATTLQSLSGQTLDPTLWEAVVVDNNSSDDTPEAFKRFASLHPGLNFRLVTEMRQGLSWARNCGIENTSGHYVVIIDDDEEANDEFLETYYDFFEANPAIGACGGIMAAKYEAPEPRWMSFITERFIGSTIDLGPRAKEFPKNKYPIGGNFGFRRSMAEKYGMFDPELGRKGALLMAGEEKDFIDRLRRRGERIWYIPGAVIQHSIPASRLTDDYFTKVTRMIGVSERLRTKNKPGGAYFGRLVSEGVKWAAAAVLCLGYMLTLQPLKGIYLLRMRWNITGGLLGFFKP